MTGLSDSGGRIRTCDLRVISPLRPAGPDLRDHRTARRIAFDKQVAGPFHLRASGSMQAVEVAPDQFTWGTGRGTAGPPTPTAPSPWRRAHAAECHQSVDDACRFGPAIAQSLVEAHVQLNQSRVVVPRNDAAGLDPDSYQWRRIASGGSPHALHMLVYMPRRPATFFPRPRTSRPSPALPGDGLVANGADQNPATFRSPSGNASGSPAIGPGSAASSSRVRTAVGDA